MEIKVVKPTDKEMILDESALKELIDYFNASVLSRDYDKGYGNAKDEMVIEVHSRKKLLVVDEAVKLINENGWEARHAYYYSTRFACPSYAIYFKPKL